MGITPDHNYPSIDHARSLARGKPRANCNIPGDIKFAGVFLCSVVIKDISADGVRLFVPGGRWLPYIFDIEADVFARPVKLCTIWSEKEHVGARFLTDRDE